MANLSAQGETAQINADFTFARRERALAVLSTAAVGSVFPAAERTALVTKITDRLAP